MLNAKILLVDDDPVFCRLMQRILTQEGAEVFTAGSCLEALSVLDEQSPDLVILDVVMPEIDGFEICRRLRDLSDVPIIMLTAAYLPDCMVEGLTCGADDFIAKPFHLPVLRARISAVLRRAGPGMAVPRLARPVA